MFQKPKSSKTFSGLIKSNFDNCPKSFRRNFWCFSNLIQITLDFFGQKNCDPNYFYIIFLYKFFYINNKHCSDNRAKKIVNKKREVFRPKSDKK